MKRFADMFGAGQMQGRGWRLPVVARPGSALFIPGLFLVALGLATVIAPRFFLALIAAFFVFVGLLLCLLAWKLIQLRRRFEQMTRSFEGRIVVHDATAGETVVEEEQWVESPRERSPDKKYTLH